MQKKIYPSKKIISLKNATKWRNALKKKGLKVAFTNGCFDILHRGHLDYLKKARNQSDALIVALNSDKSVKSIKDPSRPINSEKDRAYALASLESVDAVVVFNDTRCTKIIETLKPDLYIKGGDYCINTLNEEEKKAILDSNAKIKFIKFTKGYSTTALIEKIRTIK